MPQIKNILFDLGKVLLDFNFDNARDYFTKAGIIDYDDHVKSLIKTNIFNNIETGAISPEAFISAIGTQLNNNVSKIQIIEAWNAVLMDFRKESLSHIEKLKKHYNLYLLSNTNAIHLEEVNHMLLKQFKVSSLDLYFTKAYYSHLIGMRKPDKKAYEFVLKDAGIAAQETLFIDDLAENIEAAAILGFKTHLLLPEERIENLKSLRIWQGINKSIYNFAPCLKLL